MSFDNLNKNHEGKKANLFLLIFLTILAYAVLFIGILIPFIAVAGLAMVAVPTTLLILTGRKRDGIICAVVGSLFLFIINYLFAIFLIAYIIAVSFLYLSQYKQERAPAKTILSIALILIGVLLAYAAAVSLVNQENIYTGFLEGYRQSIDNIANEPLIARYAEIAAISQSQMESMVEQSKQLLLFIPNLLPSLIIAFLFLASLLNYYFSTAFLKRYGVSLKKIEDFSQWDFPWYYCWGVIFGLVFVLIPEFHAAYDRIFDITGFNLLILFGSLYTVLGFSVLIGIFKKYKLSIIFRFIIFFILLFLGVIFLVPLLGLADIWINIRRLKRK
jgi:MFS family permease